MLLLSDTLNCSEDLAASYVSFAINSRLPQTRSAASRAEAGLVVLLNERAALLRCLHLIWRGALSGEPGLQASGVQKALERETEDLSRSSGQASQPGFVSRIIQTIDSTKATIHTLRNQLSQPIPPNSLALASTSGSPTKLSDEAVQLRAERLDHERHALGQLLFLVAAAREMTGNDIIALAKQLQSTPSTDGVAVYTLTALLAALDASADSAEQLYPLFTDSAFVLEINKLVAPTSTWAAPQLKATVQLQWTVFLDAAARFVQNFETDGGEHVDSITWSAINAGVFSFLGKAVLNFKASAELDEVWGEIGREVPALGADAGVDESFQDYVTEQVELLIVEVITNRISILRKLRNREEDTVSTSHRGGGHRSSRGPSDDKPVENRHDLEAFFLLIATIYRDQPDGALKFWQEPSAAAPPTNGQLQITSGAATQTSRLGAFLRWGSECRPPGMMRAYYEMLASIASGPLSGTHAFEFLSSANGDPSAPSATTSWATLFGALEFYHQNLPDRRPEAGPNAEGGLGEMPPEEVPLLRSFVRVLRQVVAYSDVARATLYDNQRHRPVATLFALLGRPIPIDLKASLLQAVAAFSRPGGQFGVDVARRTWATLEQSQILPTLAQGEGRDPRGGAGLSLRGPGPLTLEGGIFTELEEVEAPNKVYPESTAFVELLNTLIHAPASSEPLRRGLEDNQQTIPETLGAPNRVPGVEPYTRFVVDDILLKTGQREFDDPREQWKVTEVCLAFVEKCLESYELGPFVAWIQAGGAKAVAVGGHAQAGSPLNQILVHPGFDMLSRLLSGSALLESVLTIVIAGHDAIAQNLAKTPLFTQCMLRCLRILKRTFDLQAAFLEVVLPAVAESGVYIAPEKLARLQTVQPVDQALLYHSEAVVQIALLVSCGEDDEIALLAVRILAVLADSPLFEVAQKFEQSRTKLNRLVGLLQASPETLRIVDGFVMRLDEDAAESDLDLGEFDGTAESGSIRQAIRRAILDLLLQTTQPDKAGPNVAHLLLGFNISARPNELEIDDPDQPETQRTALHVILDLLGQNVSPEAQDVQASILSRHPTLAAQSYRLIRQLCLHSFTSPALSRYLRNREFFFLRQVSGLPFEVPTASAGGLGALQYADGHEVRTSSGAVCAVLESEAWLLESTALELSVLSTGTEVRRQTELVGALFASARAQTEGDDEANMFGDAAVDEALPRMLDIFHSLDFAWHDGITPSPLALSFFAELKFEATILPDPSGALVYDFGLLLSLVSAAKRELQARGVLNTQAQQDQAKAETRAIVEALVVENHRRQIAHARLHALEAWRTLLDMTLTKAFDLLPLEGRQSLLLDLMGALLPPLAAQETEPAIGELLSGAAVLLMTKLRDGDELRGAEEEAVPTERLQAVLRATLDGIAQPGVSPVVRGNLYAVLLNYLQYSAKVAKLAGAAAKFSADGTEAGSVAGDESFSFADGASTIGAGPGRRSGKRHALETGNLAILQSALERLVPIVARDASVGHEVWRTVAFTLLDSLTSHFAGHGPSFGKLLSILTKQGYLQAFAAALRDSEADLLECLKEEPESLNGLYVYEAMMSWLVRLGGSSREGAERVLQSGIVTTLAQSEFLGARPQVDEGAMEFDGFLPPATERHHQLLLPALQLVVGTLVAFGAETPAASQQAVAFVNGQRETLLLALKDCQAGLTVNALKEAQLIVSLLGVVLPSVGEEELSTLSSFGGLHGALLGLAAKVLSSQWQGQLVPTTAAEQEDAQTLVLSLRATGTLFADKATGLVESLQAALLTYQVVATAKKPAGTFQPVWTAQLGRNGGGQDMVTLGGAAQFAKDVVAALEGRLEEAKLVRDRLDRWDETDVAEVEEALSWPDEDAAVALPTRRARVLAELLALRDKSTRAVAASLHVLELALLLYWRHLQFFLAPGEGPRPDFGVGRGLADALRSRGANGRGGGALGSNGVVDVDALKEGVRADVEVVRERVEGLELTAETVGAGWRGREAWLGVVGRRLGELVEGSE